MRIGILGSGDVGRSLTLGFLGRGDEVMIGTRDPAKLQRWHEETAPSARIGRFEETARFGEAIALATLWSGTESALDLAGRDNLRGKVIIDVTNPLVFPGEGPPELALGHSDSGGEQVQRWLMEAHVVKAFNTVGNGLFVKPDLAGGPPTMFYCGNDEEAKRFVRGVITDFGWEPFDVGGIEGARLL
ncbi:MAG: NAD(P)-binding domain-containing protein, partial [Candidatus Eremiobacteraeota bacterium]|nr:NAD(P)-binding domain-containing protein [Candidatus Eremiobacteraeota bacterium]